MKKIYLILLGIIVIWALILGILTWQKNKQDKLLARIKTQVQNYQNYKPDNKEYHKVKRSESNDLYYYAADNKRYVFPSIEVYRSWYGDFIIDNLKIENLETLYQTPLGGNVTFRPGTLMQTPTDPHIYLVIKNGAIRPFINEELLIQIYGADWKKSVYNLENYYFTQYKAGEAIKSLKDFPEIPSQININQDKGLE
jgi:uncharacterized protein YxeA